MSNVESNLIRIFPSTDRGSNTNAYLDNFITEYNLSSVVNKLLKYRVSNINVETGAETGFLITMPGDVKQDGGSYDSSVIEFNIGGYYVTTTIGAILRSLNGVTPETGAETAYENFVRFYVNGGKVVAKITILPNKSKYQYSQIGGQDGVDIDNNEASLGDINADDDATPVTYSLPIFNVSGGKGTYAYTSLCAESKLRFTNINIDDGVL